MNILRWFQTAFGLLLVEVAFPALAFAAKRQAHAPAHRCGAPEIDPGSVVAAVALLGCGLFMITDRFRSRR
jgi:hypothetical protein